MKQFWTMGAILLLAALLPVGCGDSKKKKEVITEKGSDTMILLAQRWAEKFGAAHPDIEVQVTGGGSGVGTSALINGMTDIANASRPMKDSEKEQIKQKYGQDVVNVVVAKDGLSVYVNKDNPIDSLTIDQLRSIYLAETTNWKDLGGNDGKIILYGRENSSGTYEFFKEHVLNKADFASVTQTLPGTAAVVNAVSKDANSIGYGGAAYGKGIKEIKVIGADGVAVAPTKENVMSGKYPLSRELHLYLRQQPAGAVKDYIDWILGPEGQSTVSEVGYFPIK